MDFATAALAQFEANPELKNSHPQIWRMLEAKPSKRRERRVALMEHEARTRLGVSEAAIDWTKVDWLRVLEWIGAILTILILL